MPLDVATLRASFPALAGPTAYFDGPGGTQTPTVVGEAIAREATPVAERSGVVTVACTSSAWAQELDLLGRQILDKIRPGLSSETPLEGFRFITSDDSV